MSAAVDRGVRGFCPMGCGRTLFLAAGGYVTCSYVDCPLPDAAASLLEVGETEHVVELHVDDFTLQHPLRERALGELFDCRLHAAIAALPRAPQKPGRYRVVPREQDAGYDWTALS